MKRYFVFRGSDYYLQRVEGMEGFIGDFDSFDDALNEITKPVQYCCNGTESIKLCIGCEGFSTRDYTDYSTWHSNEMWGQIYDSHSREIVWTHRDLITLTWEVKEHYPILWTYRDLISNKDMQEGTDD